MTEAIKVYKTVKTTFDEALEVLDVDEYIANNKTGYEGIFGAVYPYFDFDVKYDTLKEQQAAADDVLKKVCDEVRRLFPEGTLAVSTSNGLKRTQRASKSVFVNSIHIVCHGPKYVYGDGAALLSHIRNKWECDIPFDENVYRKIGRRQLFRLVGCSKEGENRPFVKVNPEQPTSEFIVSVPLLARQTYMLANLLGSDEKPRVRYIPEAEEDLRVDCDATTSVRLWRRFVELESWATETATVRGIERGEGFSLGSKIILSTTRLCASYCDICKRVHDSDNTLYVVVIEGYNKIMRGCTRMKDTMKFVGKYDEDRPIFEPPKFTAINAALRRGPVSDLQYPFANIRGTKNVKKTICKVKYISDDPRIMNDTSEIVVIRGNMGIGKSYATHEKIRDMLEKNPEARIVLNTFRTSLASDFKRKYADLGFVCYSDVEGSIKAQKLIIQQDSYNRIDLKSMTSPDLFVIDEIDQVQKHMTSKTYLGQRDTRASNWAKFRWCVKYAKQVLVMSAGVTDVQINWLLGMRTTNGTQVSIFHNKFEDETKKRKVLLTDNKFNVIRSASKSLKNGKRVYIAHNGSKERIHALVAFITKTTKATVLTVCSDTLHKPEVKAALADANEEFGKYDCIVCSSSIQSGISYDPYDVFDRVYGMFENWTNLSSDCVQMLHRIRHPIDNTMLIYVAQTNRMPKREYENFYSDLGYAAKHILDGTDRCHLASMCGVDFDENGLMHISMNDYTRLYVDNKISGEEDRVSFVRRFIHYLREEGHDEIEEIVTVDGEHEGRCRIMSKIIKKYIVAIKLDLFKGMCQELADALEITPQKDDDIVQSMKVAKHTDKDKAEHIKYTIAREYHMAKTPNDVEWYQTYSKKPIRRHFKNQRKICWDPDLKKSLEGVKHIELTNHAQFLENEAKAGRRGNEDAMAMQALNTTYDYKRWELLFSMLCMIGIDSFYASSEIKPSDMVEGLDSIRRKFLSTWARSSQTHSLLGKRDKTQKSYDALIAMDKTDTGFIKTMLEFVNGTLRADFGVSIKRVKPAKHKGDDMKIPYALHNPYLKKGLFKNTLCCASDDQVLKFGIHTPVFGGNREVEDAILQEKADDYCPPVSDEEFKKALDDLGMEFDNIV